MGQKCGRALSGGSASVSHEVESGCLLSDPGSAEALTQLQAGGLGASLQAPPRSCLSVLTAWLPVPQDTGSKESKEEGAMPRVASSQKSLMPLPHTAIIGSKSLNPAHNS